MSLVSMIPVAESVAATAHSHRDTYFVLQEQIKDIIISGISPPLRLHALAQWIPVGWGTQAP